ncbi:MAG: putative selenoprotein [Proteobacteria bacterium]|nr:putative selenoprotein [Pseudomonadota bacterium]
MKKSFYKIWTFFRSIKDYIDGDFAYENYLKHHQKFHKDEKALDKKSFLKNLQNKKWSKINRCC